MPSRSLHRNVGKIDRVALGIALGLALLALCFAALSYRPLYADSGPWLLSLLQYNTVVWDWALYRHLDAALQLPALLLRTLAGPRDWTRAIILAWGFAYILQPVASLVLSWAICRRARAENAFLFPVFSFATATLITMGNSGSVVPTSLSVFWPLLLFDLLEKPGRLRVAGALVGSVCLAFTHEAAFLLFAALLAGVFLRENSRSRSPETWVRAAFFLMGAVWLGLRGILTSHKTFTGALVSHWGPFTWSAISATGVFLLALGGRRWLHLREGWFLAAGWLLSISIFAALVLNNPSEFGSLHLSFNARVVSAPLAAALGLAAVWFARSTQVRWKPLSLFAAAFLLHGALYDLGTTLRWRVGVEHVQSALARKGPGCKRLSKYEADEFFSPYGMLPWYLPHYSILLQFTRQPTGILASWPYNDARERDFCGEVAAGQIPLYDGAFLLFDGYMDYSVLKQRSKNP